MKTSAKLFVVLIATALLLLVGCSNNSSPAVAEGVIYYVEYLMEGGGKGGLTRVNNSRAVPGGNGSWNVDAYGRLTRDFLIITRPQKENLGPLVIPVGRLLSVQFGDGGLKQVNENQPAPGS